MLFKNNVFVMKKPGIALFVLGVLLLAFTTCKKDPDVNIETFEIVTEELSVHATTVGITGSFSFTGKIDGITVLVADNAAMSHAKSYVAEVEGKSFTAELTGLKVATTYHYCYSVDYGFSKPYKTEAKSFATQSEAPTVSTLEVMQLNESSFRVKCEVTADGGLEVTERGICWNTYGDPTLDDETMKHANGGLGQYTLRLENLAPAAHYYVRAYARNATGVGFGEVLEFSTVAPVELPAVSTVEVSSVTATTASCLCNVSSDGGAEVTERGTCWGTGQTPTISGSHVASGTGVGEYTVQITSLTANTSYYVRAYAKNSKGISYGEAKRFTTLEGLPVVTTSGVTDITATSAKCGGTVTDQGASTVTERGVCWSTSHNPTTSGSHASSGTGTGSFTVNMTGLTPNATYYARAYAKNSQGTSYGSEVSFVALAGLPSVTTSTPTSVTSSGVTCGGNVTDQGASTVTERGVCWSTSANPTTSGSHQAASSGGAGNFTVNIASLTPGTTYHVRAYAKNSQGTSYGSDVTFTTTANVPTVTTSTPSSVTSNSATGGGNVTNAGGATVTERGICWGTSANPTISNSHQAASSGGTGSFTANMTGLSPGTTYHVRAYAKNSAGTGYGTDVTFTTSAVAPTVTTAQVTNITQTTAQGGGNVTNAGGATVTERGICWSTSHNPTISGTHASNGMGTGSYTVNMTGLTANTTYYVRAYAKNSAGTSYGSEVSFTTSQSISSPTVTTSQVTNITQTTATGGGNVTSDGGANVTERGICWSTAHNPTISGSHATSGTGTGSFTANMTSLTAGTTYYVRAYAKNSQGTSYGSEVNFSTTATTPTVTTATPTNVTSTSATCGSNVTNDGGATVTERGVCWSTSTNPTTSGSHLAASAGGTGSFTVSVTALTPGTTYHVRAYAKNSAGTSYGEDKTVTMGANAPTVTTTTPTNVTTTSATMGGNVTNSGGATVTERGVCWSTTSNPTTNGSHLAASSGGTGSFTVSVTGLTPGTTYHVRAYAKNSAGNSYGSEVSFTTTGNVPTVTTTTATNITATTATSGGNVTSSGGATVIVRGVCWSTSQNPTIDDYHTTDGSGTGSFSSSMTNLSLNTTYYVRAYATSANGTGYGEQKSFTTKNGVPVLTTSSVTDIGSSWATGGGNVTDDGGFSITQRGICWSTGHNPTTSGNHQAAANAGTGSFEVGMSGLTANTTYYVRAYATNSHTTAYGSEVSFTTTVQPNAPTGAINGLFSVSATQQVYFSQGNLQYQMGTHLWRFAENQWDYVDQDYENLNYYSWFDLFGWGTSGYNHGAVCYQPWSTSQTNSDYYAYGNYQYNLYDQTGQADWGYNAISNGGNTENSGWRTPTHEEWSYLFNTRSTSSGIRYAKAQVNDINGVILLPDDWSSSYYTLSNTNQGGANYSVNVIMAYDWSVLEQHGAVFLPAAGGRYGTSVNGVGSYGYYWSASSNYSGTAWYVDFYGSYLSTDGNGNRYNGQSVRLVRSFQ